MGKVAKETDFKTQLVTEICSLSNPSNISCIHKHFCSPSTKSTIIDWYRLLGVEEDSGEDVIRKRYHKLALQLHPDKNKHPKAEIAFKLVSEAYECLSNSDKRRVFDLERWRNTCIECNSNDVNTKSGLKHNKVWQTSDESRSNRSVLRGLKDIRDRFREETRVIENCLRMNAAPKKEQASLFDSSDYLFGINTRTQKESPVFNPSNYKCQSYPHLRTQIYKNNMDKFWYFGRGKCDSPIFEVKSDRGTFKSKSTCVHS